MTEITAGSSTDHSRVGSRSRVRAGQLLGGVDGRSWWVRRAKTIVRELVTDLGGVENCSVAERAICRRIAVLEIELERLEHRFALLPDDVAADPADIDLYQRTSGGWRRLLEAIGLRRRPREIEADPLDYAREHTAP